MKTHSSGNFSCETYLKSWELGFRDGTTLSHTQSCPFCRPIVHGGTEDCRLSAEDEAKRTLLARRRSRRRFFATAAASALALIGTTTAVQSYMAAPSTSPLVVAIAGEDARFDLVYQLQGAAGIATLVHRSDQQTAKNVLEWIARRSHWVMLPLVISSMEAKLEDTRTKALIILMHHVPAIELKPYISDLHATRMRCRDEVVANYLDSLIEDVELS